MSELSICEHTTVSELLLHYRTDGGHREQAFNLKIHTHTDTENTTLAPSRETPT